MDLSRALEIIKGRLYFISTKGHFQDTESQHFFSTDATLCYEPFYSDFGPLNLSHVYRFCKALRAKLKSPKYKNKTIIYYCSTKPQYRANSAVLMGSFQVIYMNKTAKDAYAPLTPYEPFIPFRDASMGLCSYKLTVFHALQGLRKARKFNFFDFDSFNAEEYEYFECVENGDLNVLVPNKFVAFAGPHRTRQGADGYPQLTPEDYFPIWKKYNVSTIVRLNRKMYDAHKFVDAGFKHYDLFFIDGTTPSRQILDSFIHLAEQDEGIMAVHCKAGLGRTGTLIGCYIMKHYHFTADEVIAWMRICRPGSVIGPQQQYLIAQQPRMWAEGEQYRKERGLTLPWEDWMDNEEYIDTPTSSVPTTPTKHVKTSSSSSSLAPASPQTPMALSAKPVVAAVTPRSPTDKQKLDRKKRADNASGKIAFEYPNQDPLSAKKAPQVDVCREAAQRTSNYAPIKLQF